MNKTSDSETCYQENIRGMDTKGRGEVGWIGRLGLMYVRYYI